MPHENKTMYKGKALQTIEFLYEMVLWMVEG